MDTYTPGSTIPGRADGIIPLKLQHIRLIASRRANHIFRPFHVPDDIERLWLFDPGQACAITHFVTISRAKGPGEVNDPAGLGNVDFDNGLMGGICAYEVLGLSKLLEPISGVEMFNRDGVVVRRGWMRMSEYWADRALSGGIVGLF